MAECAVFVYLSNKPWLLEITNKRHADLNTNKSQFAILLDT